MQPETNLEAEANKFARTYMGAVALPTVCFAVIIFASYVSVIYATMFGGMSLLLGYILASILTYASYTILHDAVHGSIGGASNKYSWLNNGLGYLAGQIMMVPFTAHQQEHLAHHRHTNDENDDPDHFLDDDSLWSLIKGTLLVLPLQYKYYRKHNWATASRRANLILTAEIILMFSWRLAFVTAGFHIEALVLLIGSLATAVFALIILFVWLVHRPYDKKERYLNTNTFVMPGWLDTPMSWLWLFQNYHSVHHLFPRVPFYHYKALFKKIEPIMISKNAPIIRVGQ